MLQRWMLPFGSIIGILSCPAVWFQPLAVSLLSLMMHYSTQCFDDAQNDAHAHTMTNKCTQLCTCAHMLADGRCTNAHINAHDKFPHLVRWQRNDPATVISRIPRAAINHPEKWYLGLSFLHNSVLGAPLKQLCPTRDRSVCDGDGVSVIG